MLTLRERRRDARVKYCKPKCCLHLHPVRKGHIRHADRHWSGSLVRTAVLRVIKLCPWNGSWSSLSRPTSRKRTPAVPFRDGVYYIGVNPSFDAAKASFCKLRVCVRRVPINDVGRPDRIAVCSKRVRIHVYMRFGQWRLLTAPRRLNENCHIR